MQYMEDDLLPTVTFQDPLLTIRELQQIEKNFYTIQSELPFKQFNEENSLEDGSGEFRNGDRVMLIRASEDIELKSDGNVTYIN